ncbi:MAG TPA: VOC family protein [Bryobacteraceae bacterium]|nr:VOC family protein [Bryobacteraceae bacterium]
MAVKPIPDNYHAVTPYLIVSDAARLIDFLKQAFEAQEIERFLQPDGRVMHAEVRIRDSVIMMGEPMPGMTVMPASLLLYVTDCDAAYRQAIAAGATAINEPADQFYGDRSGGLKDPAGNMWWISTHKEDVAPEEMKRRVEAMMQQKKAGA